MLIDFGRSTLSPGLMNIDGVDIELTDNHKYLGIIIDDKLSFEANVSVVCKKIQQRLFFLRKMGTFNVCTKMLTLLYKAFIESVFSFCIVAWFGNLTLSNRNRLNNL